MQGSPIHGALPYMNEGLKPDSQKLDAIVKIEKLQDVAGVKQADRVSQIPVQVPE